MGFTEIAKANPSASEAALLDLARELAALRWEGMDQAQIARRIADGLQELSRLAKECGQSRVSRACKALSTILERLDRGQGEDVGVILSTASNFLDALQARRLNTGKGNL